MGLADKIYVEYILNSVNVNFHSLDDMNNCI